MTKYTSDADTMCDAYPNIVSEITDQKFHMYRLEQQSKMAAQAVRATIIADASFCPDEQVAGYGYWIASPRGKHGGGGVCVHGGRVQTSTVAEMMAVCNAIWHAINRGLIRHHDSVLLQTDCTGAIQAFEGSRGFLSKQESDAVNYISSVESKYEISFTYRHVKGHTRNRDARSVTNAICDKKARLFMQRARTASKAKKLKERMLEKD